MKMNRQERIESIANLLYRRMTWDNTLKGHTFWSEVKNELIKESKRGICPHCKKFIEND